MRRPWLLLLLAAGCGPSGVSGVHESPDSAAATAPDLPLLADAAGDAPEATDGGDDGGLPDLGVPDAAQPRECADDGQCADPARPHCNEVGRCAACASDGHCGDGQICRDDQCRPGCGSGKGCGDGGACDEDAGQCRRCRDDQDCGGGAPRCEAAGGRCVACLPANDNCPPGESCALVNGAFACERGCKQDGDCPRGSACCNKVCRDLAADGMSCGACGRGCPPGQGCCGGLCLDPEIDLKNCGGCGLVCAPKRATGACRGGRCDVARCDDGFADCDGAPGNGCEVDLAHDPAHCGACGRGCMIPRGTAGCDGKCIVAACDPGAADCNRDAADGCEVDLVASVLHCGGCGQPCGKAAQGSSACRLGRCELAGCDPGFADCDGRFETGCERDLRSDAASCGQCGRACATPANGVARCAAGQCALGACTAPFLDCNQLPGDGCEVNPQSDERHCGGCGRACAAVANGTVACVAGSCRLEGCKGGFADCNQRDNDGCETDLAGDLRSCGACGKGCPAVANGTAACRSGVCGVGGCNAPFADCDKDPSNGCETDLAADIRSCGACGAPCAQVSNGRPACVAGKCVIGACEGAFRDCDGDAKNGCETNTADDLAHCGACGNRCPNPPNGAPACAAGKCGVANCGPPFRDCNGNPQDGCEANTDTDERHCGRCGAPCGPVAHGVPGCSGGRCGVGSCSAPWQDCRNGAADGCETDTGADVANCGGCNQRCPAVPHGAASCQSGQCAIAACDAPFADCRNGLADGCETDLGNDAKSCGACGRVCPLVANGTPACKGGQCAVGGCGAPWADCNGQPGDGCEANLDQEAAHCGACGARCTVANGTPACVLGECAIESCQAPYRDCRNGYADGCETNSGSDVQSCGACGNRCVVQHGQPVCQGGVCAIASCTAPYRDCKNGYGDGCETDASGDPQNCGACGNRCQVQNGTAGCAQGACTVAACSAGFANCNKLVADGCEVNLKSDPKSCGSCGLACASGVCLNGNCFYAPRGPQLDVPIAGLNGWSECYRGGYDEVLPVAQIKQRCAKPKIMLACRLLNATKLTLLAWAPRNDVFFNTGDGNATHEANLASWYYSDNYSMGFAVEGDPVFRNQCDVLNFNSGYRLCWHTLPDLGGWRCGAAVNLNEAWVWERLVFQAD